MKTGLYHMDVCYTECGLAWGVTWHNGLLRRYNKHPFVLFALAELSYITYHFDWTVFRFAHLISEVLELLAFIFVFMGLTFHPHDMHGEVVVTAAK